MLSDKYVWSREISYNESNVKKVDTSDEQYEKFGGNIWPAIR